MDAKAASERRRRNFVAVGIAFGAIVLAAGIVSLVLFLPQHGSDHKVLPTVSIPPTSAPYHGQYPRVELVSAYRLEDAALVGNTNCNPSTADFGRLASSSMQDRIMMQWGNNTANVSMNPCANFPFFAAIENNGDYKMESDIFNMYRIVQNPTTGEYANVFTGPIQDGKVDKLFVNFTISEAGNVAAASMWDKDKNGYLTGYLRDPLAGWTYYPFSFVPSGSGISPQGSQLGAELACTDDHVFASVEHTLDPKAIKGVYAADVDRSPRDNDSQCFLQTKLSGFPLTYFDDGAFGRALALGGTTQLAITGENAAYLYDYSSGRAELQYKCERPPNVDPTMFGCSAGVLGTRVVVGGNACASVYESGKLVQVVRPEPLQGLPLAVSAVECQMTSNTLAVASKQNEDPGYTGEGVMCVYRANLNTTLYMEGTLNDPQVLTGNAIFGATMTMHEDLQGALSINAQSINSMTRFNFVP